MGAPILDQPLIPVAGGHVENVDRYHRDDRLIRAFDIAHGQERIGDRDVGFDEADPIVRERCLRGGGDGLFPSGPKSFTMATCPCRKSPTGVTKVPFSANSEARCSAFF
jgi:hypothetical protein